MPVSSALSSSYQLFTLSSSFSTFKLPQPKMDPLWRFLQLICPFLSNNLSLLWSRKWSSSKDKRYPCKCPPKRLCISRSTRSPPKNGLAVQDRALTPPYSTWWKQASFFSPVSSCKCGSGYWGAVLLSWSPSIGFAALACIFYQSIFLLYPKAGLDTTC